MSAYDELQGIIVECRGNDPERIARARALRDRLEREGEWSKLSPWDRFAIYAAMGIPKGVERHGV